MRCASANSALNHIICDYSGGPSYLFDLDTYALKKRELPVYGPMTADGRYILKRSENSSVYDLQTDTTFPLEPIPQNEEGERPSVSYPTQHRPDGTFAFSFSDTDDYHSNIIYEANFNEVLEKKGQGFSFTRVEDALQNNRLQGKVQDYVGNNLSMEIKVRFDSPPRCTIDSKIGRPRFMPAPPATTANGRCANRTKTGTAPSGCWSIPAPRRWSRNIPSWPPTQTRFGCGPATPSSIRGMCANRGKLKLLTVSSARLRA